MLEYKKGGEMMKNILVTGFDPFGGESINPSWEAVRRLPDEIEGVKIEKLEIPTVYAKAAEKVIACAEGMNPDAIICVGQAGGRAAITPEVVGINIREGKLADNEGVRYGGEPIIEGAPAAYFSTLPVRDMVTEISKEGIPASLSYSAGAFVCNDTLYTLLHHYRDSDVKVGFVHVPYLPEQVKNGEPSLTLDTVIRAIDRMILTIK